MRACVYACMCVQERQTVALEVNMMLLVLHKHHHDPLSAQSHTNHTYTHTHICLLPSIHPTHLKHVIIPAVWLSKISHTGQTDLGQSGVGLWAGGGRGFGVNTHTWLSQHGCKADRLSRQLRAGHPDWKDRWTGGQRRPVTPSQYYLSQTSNITSMYHVLT